MIQLGKIIVVPAGVLCYCFNVIGFFGVCSVRFVALAIVCTNDAPSSLHVESPHIWTQLRARQAHEPVVPLQEINALEPFLLLDRGSPWVTVNPLMERQRYLPLRLLRLHIELLLGHGKTERGVYLGEDVEDGDEVCGFADDV